MQLLLQWPLEKQLFHQTWEPTLLKALPVFQLQVLHRFGRIGTELGDCLRRHCGTLTRVSRRISASFLCCQGSPCTRACSGVRQSAPRVAEALSTMP